MMLVVVLFCIGVAFVAGVCAGWEMAGDVRDRPVTPGMARVTIPGHPPIDVPPTPELIAAMADMFKIVEGNDG